MKTNEMSSIKLERKDLISVTIVIVLIVLASNKYGIIPVLKGLGIFTAILMFNLAVIRVYQECMAYLKTKSWKISPLYALFLVMLVIGIPLMFVLYLKDTYLTFGVILSVVVLGGLLIYSLVGKVFR
ncbi:hypothetical protein [Pleomorphovibrio marinus]|uniref:hypothetical protein n=1 Tax=Pleomorphovibrio marinus TaxID=2164132 RepID=UPI000E0AF789|nr:hypothetical protein [Pleomorphovibrio marinus]